MALDRAIRCGNDTSESVYESRGVWVFVSLLFRKQIYFREHFMQPMFIEGQIFCNRKTNDIGLRCNCFQHRSQLLKGHTPSTGAIAYEFRIREVGGVEYMLIQDINIKMY